MGWPVEAMQLTGRQPVQGQEPVPKPDLLRALGRLVRGLSVLFWGLPIALVTCWQTAYGDWFSALGIAPAVLSTALLLYGLELLSHFQKQERVWRSALERARLFAIVNLGLSPFLYWSSQASHPFFTAMQHFMFLSGLCFLYTLNPMLWRLSAMLPDETLRLETKLFTGLNRCLLLFTLVISAAYFAVLWIKPPIRLVAPIPPPLVTALTWTTLFVFLLPVAMTMALTWKIKEAVFSGVFGAGQ